MVCVFLSPRGLEMPPYVLLARRLADAKWDNFAAGDSRWRVRKVKTRGAVR
jgi:hypothetical protein